jgi:biopolymer transport protein TolQ
MIKESSLIIKIVLAILAVMSMASWTVIFFKLLQLHKAKKEIANDLSRLEDAPDLLTAMKLMGKSSNSICRQLAAVGLKELKRLKTLDRLSANTSEVIIRNLRLFLGQETNGRVENLFGSLFFLATCVNVAPFIGLFGTVWGIMHSFYAIGLMRTATLAAVAPGMSEALTTTALGLAVAIPASLAYNFLTRVLGGIERDLTKFTAIFLRQIRIEILGKKVKDPPLDHLPQRHTKEYVRADAR